LDSLCIIANDAASLKKQIKSLKKKSFGQKAIQERAEKLGLLYHNGNNIERLIELVT
jgi:hypothetical protein